MTYPHAPAITAHQRPVWVAYVAEGLTTIGTSLLMLGVFFYTTDRLGWRPAQNLLLAAGQGVAYVLAALSAEPLSARLTRRGTLLLACLLASLLAIMASFAARSTPLVATLLIAYTFATTLIWPVLESLVTAGTDAAHMSRRVGVYNLVWSGVNVIGVALSGAIITRFPMGVFLLPAVAHAVAALLVLSHPAVEPGETRGAAALPPEPRLLRLRTLALWLSRIALPATFMVIYSMMAIMPALPVMRHVESTAARTLLSSVWLATRFAAFIVLGMTAWWHTRPASLLAATVLMLIAFCGITIRPGDLAPVLGLAAPGQAVDLAAMIAAQVAMGLVVALIYASSLYFGMVLSEGSTEHGGYHEALIGVGEILGPGSGALAQWLFPNRPWASIAAVTAVIAASALAAGVAALRARGRR